MSMKEKIFSRKISILGKEISAIFIAFAVMGVLGAAIISSYGTSVQTVTVSQGLTFSPAEQKVTGASVPSVVYLTNNIVISNAGNIDAYVDLKTTITNVTGSTDSVPLIGVVYTNSDHTSEIGPTNVLIPAGKSVNVNANITFPQKVEPGDYNITTTITPTPTTTSTS